MTCRNFGHLVTEGNIGGIMECSMAFIPRAAVHLRVLMQQALDSGLTCLDMIAQAIHEHPHFPRHIVRRMYRRGWERVMNAVALVGDNRYYVYHHDLDAVCSTQFKYPTWVYGCLLIHCCDVSLRRYRGFVS